MDRLPSCLGARECLGVQVIPSTTWSGNRYLDGTLRLKRLEKALKTEWTPESAVVALEYDRTSTLLEKFEAGVISEFVFEAQLRKISPVNISWKKVPEFHKSHPELYRP